MFKFFFKAKCNSYRKVFLFSFEQTLNNKSGCVENFQLCVNELLI